ncbi:hypothetical protein LHFGNBLO_004909 [Mesorhizobium sp. AR10]|nr:hypothetical protein LHFGNBLO_004909 [Mesorhizobium sp. AR10]
MPKIISGVNARFVLSHSSGPSSSPAWTRTGADVPDPVVSPLATGTAGAVPPPAPATLFGEGTAGTLAQGTSCIRTEDGTVILFDRRTGRAVSAATRHAAEAAMLRLASPSTA